MRTWLVAGAVIERPAGVLLVENRRHDGRTDWTPPGGVIDDGEALLVGLAREVTEETGLVVDRWHPAPLYRIEAEAPDLGWQLTVEVHRAVDTAGDLALSDPDGIVVDACWLSPADCLERLTNSPPWVRDPLQAWLVERWAEPRLFRYRIEGTDLRSLQVHSLDD